MGVKTKRGGDNKLRKTGDVGSHSTLVTEAKTPTTNINNVKIDKKVEEPVQKIDNPELAEAIADEVAAKAGWNRNYKALVDAEKKANHKLVNYVEDPNIVKAAKAFKKSWKDLDYKTAIREKVEVTIEWKAVNDTLFHAINDVLRAEKDNPAFSAARGKMHLSSGPENDKAISEYEKLLRSYPDVGEAWKALDRVELKVDKARDKLKKLSK